jgi:hypothetical protein
MYLSILIIYAYARIRCRVVMNIGKTVRTAVQKLAVEIDSCTNRLSHDEIIHACSITTPSSIGTYTSVAFIL